MLGLQLDALCNPEDLGVSFESTVPELSTENEPVKVSLTRIDLCHRQNTDMKKLQNDMNNVLETLP